MKRGEGPVRAFLFAQTRPRILGAVLRLGAWSSREREPMCQRPCWRPAFLISELKTAFQMGFMIYVPFLVIDIVVAVILLSMGMMMLPPVMISSCPSKCCSL